MKRNPVGEPLDPKKLTDLLELLMALVWIEEALVALLEEMGTPSRRQPHQSD